MFKTNPKGKNRFSPFWILLVLFFAIFYFLFSYRVSDSSNKPMNIVVILTDDQRYDTLWAMPKTQELLAKQGVVFDEAIVSTPLCCPSRTGFLSGGYFTRNTGVLTNLFPNGGAINFSKVDVNAMPNRLQKAGYNTGLFGKYLNEYPAMETESTDTPWPYIPPGWNSFVISEEHNTPLDWWNFPVVKGYSQPFKAKQGKIFTVENQYITNYFTDELITFVEKSQEKNTPFFAILSTHGPHGPSKYEAQDADKFSDYVYNAPSLEEDISDKPEYIKDESIDFDPTLNIKTYRNMLRSLQPIDRSVEKIITKLKELNIIDNTVIVFTSDHGYMWGEHKINSKGVPYEESIRVPFIIVYPNGKKNIIDNSYVYGNLDLAATIQEIAGIKIKSEGESLIPLLISNTDSTTNWRKEIYAEWFKVGSLSKKSSWSMIKIKTDTAQEFKYTEYQYGDKELYLLSEDPFEENNLINEPKYATRIERFAKKLAPKKGISISPRNTIDGNLPIATINTPYNFKFEVWGSKPPYNWSLVEGILPKGLYLDTTNGVISGIPKEMTIDPVKLKFKVTGSSKATYADRPQEFTMSFQLMVLSQEINPSNKSKEINWFKTIDLNKEKLEVIDEIWMNLDEN